MKTKRINYVSVMLGRLLFIGFSVQIVFGIIWIVKNIDYVQMIEGASYNLTLSSLLKGDGDTGILYPSIILLSRALGQITFIPWYSYVYIFQIVLGIASVYFLLKETRIFGGKPRRYIWGSLVILTFPLVLQVHMALLVNSIVLSLFVFQCATLIRAWKVIDEKKTSVIDYVYSISGVALFWLLLSLTQWAYFFIGAVPVFAVLLVTIVSVFKKSSSGRNKEKSITGGKEARKTILLVLVTSMIFLGLIIGLDRLTTDNSISQRAEFNWEMKLFERMAWKSRFCRMGTWMDEFKSVVGNEVLINTSQNPENIKLVLEPELINALGEEKTLELVRLTNEVVWNYDRNELLHDLLVDTAGYVMPPIMTDLLLEKNNYVSFTARNYDAFKRNEPMISKYYIDYSLLWFEASLVIGAVILLFGFIGKMIKVEKSIVGAFVIIAITCSVIVVRNVMLGNSMYDYKQAGSAAIFWFMAIFICCGNAMFDEDVK